MNEGHAALLSLALLEEQVGDPDLGKATEADIEEVRGNVYLQPTPRFRPATINSPGI